MTPPVVSTETAQRTQITLHWQTPLPWLSDESPLSALEESFWLIDGLESVERVYNPSDHDPLNDQRETCVGFRLIGTEAGCDEPFTQEVMEHLHTINSEMVASLGLPPLTVTDHQTVEDDDWAESWKQHWHVMRLLPDVVIQPSWEANSPNSNDIKPTDIVLKLDPGSAFGTGTHPTTQLMLLALRDLAQDNLIPERGLDVGTGSGILAIYMAKLGVRNLSANDCDPKAVTVALDNARLNGVTLDGRAEELSAFIGQPYDWVCANILASVLVELMPELVQCLAPEGWLLLSGIITKQIDMMQDSLSQNGLVLRRSMESDGWMVLMCQRATARS